MAKIKLTKTELKSQQDALKQYKRFLPTLQLKKQQLQMEIRQSIELLEANEAEERRFSKQLDCYIAIFGDAEIFSDLKELVKLDHIDRDYANIAGVNVPVYREAVFAPVAYDFFVKPWALDDAVKALKECVALREAHKIIEEQHRLLSEELRTTTQRVNLFEKVKIPECRENIRVIRIQLGDLDTAAVARSKIAKRKTLEATAS